MRIRTAAPADAERIAALHTASRRSTYAALMPAGYLHGPPADLSVACCSPRRTARKRVRSTARSKVPCGASSASTRPPAATSTWTTCTSGRDVFLEVLRGNDRAIVFYERQGGLRTAERPLRLASGLVLDEIEYTWPAARVGRVAGPPQV